MTSSKSINPQAAYLDFAQFNKLKKEYRTDSDAGIKSTAKQLEGVFLNMMLKSMRQANASFAEGNYLNSGDSEQYRDMYDQQLSMNLAANNGIGLADMIVRQMKQLENHNIDKVQPGQSFDISAYRDRAIPALLRNDMTEKQKVAFEQDVAMESAEARIYAPEKADIVARQEDSPKWQSPEEFVETIWPHAEKAARQLNVDPMAIVAQAVLETGWGQHVVQDADGQHGFNLFGIKSNSAWEGDTVNKKTLEYRNGIAAPESASFRSYPSLESAFDDYVKFLKGNPRYKNVFELNSDAKQWGYKLQDAGYATDPNYGNKIARLMESDILRAKTDSTNTTL